MISFESDYNNGMLPEILEALGREQNGDKASGYGFDPYSESAKEKIRKAVDKENAEVFFLTGGYARPTPRSLIPSSWDAKE